MTKITEEMIEMSYEVYFTKDQDIEPLLKIGMNESSAKMTMVWFEKMFSGELYKRTGSAFQIEWLLTKLYEEKDFNRLRSSLKSLNKYCDYYDFRPMVKVRNTIKTFEKKLM